MDRYRGRVRDNKQSRSDLLVQVQVGADRQQSAWGRVDHRDSSELFSVRVPVPDTMTVTLAEHHRNPTPILVLTLALDLMLAVVLSLSLILVLTLAP